MREDFYTNFKKRYGFKISDDPIHIDSIAVEVFNQKIMKLGIKLIKKDIKFSSKKIILVIKYL